MNFSEIKMQLLIHYVEENLLDMELTFEEQQIKSELVGMSSKPVVALMEYIMGLRRPYKNNFPNFRKLKPILEKWFSQPDIPSLLRCIPSTTLQSIISWEIEKELSKFYQPFEDLADSFQCVKQSIIFRARLYERVKTVENLQSAELFLPIVNTLKVSDQTFLMNLFPHLYPMLITYINSGKTVEQRTDNSHNCHKVLGKTVIHVLDAKLESDRLENFKLGDSLSLLCAGLLLYKVTLFTENFLIKFLKEFHENPNQIPLLTNSLGLDTSLRERLPKMSSQELVKSGVNCVKQFLIKSIDSQINLLNILNQWVMEKGEPDIDRFTAVLSLFSFMESDLPATFLSFYINKKVFIQEYLRHNGVFYNCFLTLLYFQLDGNPLPQDISVSLYFNELRADLLRAPNKFHLTGLQKEVMVPNKIRSVLLKSFFEFISIQHQTGSCLYALKREILEPLSTAIKREARNKELLSYKGACNSIVLIYLSNVGRAIPLFAQLFEKEQLAIIKTRVSTKNKSEIFFEIDKLLIRLIRFQNPLDRQNFINNNWNTFKNDFAAIVSHKRTKAKDLVNLIFVFTIQILEKWLGESNTHFNLFCKKVSESIELSDMAFLFHMTPVFIFRILNESPQVAGLLTKAVLENLNKSTYSENIKTRWLMKYYSWFDRLPRAYAQQLKAKLIFEYYFVADHRFMSDSFFAFYALVAREALQLLLTYQSDELCDLLTKKCITNGVLDFDVYQKISSKLSLPKSFLVYWLTQEKMLDALKSYVVVNEQVNGKRLALLESEDFPGAVITALATKYGEITIYFMALLQDFERNWFEIRTFLPLFPDLVKEQLYDNGFYQPLCEQPSQYFLKQGQFIAGIYYIYMLKALPFSQISSFVINQKAIFPALCEHFITDKCSLEQVLGAVPHEFFEPLVSELIKNDKILELLEKNTEIYLFISEVLYSYGEEKAARNLASLLKISDELALTTNPQSAHEIKVQNSVKDSLSELFRSYKLPDQKDAEKLVQEYVAFINNFNKNKNMDDALSIIACYSNQEKHFTVLIIDNEEKNISAMQILAYVYLIISDQKLYIDVHSSETPQMDIHNNKCGLMYELTVRAYDEKRKPICLPGFINRIVSFLHKIHPLVDIQRAISPAVVERNLAMDKMPIILSEKFNALPESIQEKVASEWERIRDLFSVESTISDDVLNLIKEVKSCIESEYTFLATEEQLLDELVQNIKWMNLVPDNAVDETDLSFPPGEALTHSGSKRYLSRSSFSVNANRSTESPKLSRSSCSVSNEVLLTTNLGVFGGTVNNLKSSSSMAGISVAIRASQ